MERNNMLKPDFARAVGTRVLQIGSRLLDYLFYDLHTPAARRFRAAWFGALFLFGALLWGVFFIIGNIAFDFLDWAEVTGPRYALLQDAVQKGVLPLHTANTTALRGATDRYFSIADTPFSPQILLLRFLDMG